MDRLRRNLGLALRLFISGGILWWLSRRIDWAQMGEEFARAGHRPGWILLAALAMGLVLALTAWRWQRLLRIHHIEPGFSHVFQVTMIGQFFNAFLLGTTGGDVVKILYIVRSAPRKKGAAGLSVVVDRVIGLVALVLITLALAFVYHRYLTATPAAVRALATFCAIAAGIGGVLAGAALLPWLMHFTNFAAWERRLPFHERIERLGETLRHQSRARRVNAQAFLLSIASHGLTLFAQYAVTRALGIELSLGVVAAVAGVVNVLIAVPVSVAGLGVRESLFVLFLGLGGVSDEAAVAASLIGFALTLFWSVVGGLFYLRYRHPLHLEEVAA
ncbi:MAG: lysylphosphatidylglycerol synthase transmembrane domain-containing protein [Verrucomicrobium sp.]|nr:lysylphosphatidylglycerol synthase transmembrane domain-containing protein [Verrucomicrobium sp.]